MHAVSHCTVAMPHPELVGTRGEYPCDDVGEGIANCIPADDDALLADQHRRVHVVVGDVIRVAGTERRETLVKDALRIHAVSLYGCAGTRRSSLVVSSVPHNGDHQGFGCRTNQLVGVPSYVIVVSQIE